jgi:dolichyl-phosphate beta-glucosyltransferase
VLRLPHRGKGAAVRAGVEAATGDPIVFLDADLTIPVEILDLFNGALETGADIAIASRYIAGSIVDRPWWRRVMGDVFRGVVHLLVPTDIRDTQCGGKMYTAEAAKHLFAKQRLDGFSFDAEVLFLARRAGYNVREIPFALRQHNDTRIDFLADTPKMLRDLFVIRLNAMRGLYGR